MPITVGSAGLAFPGPTGLNSGRLQDVRDGYTLVRDPYRDAWLVDNRPYGLQNNLVRYDRAAQLWVGRGGGWSRLIWYRMHTLQPISDSPLAVH